MKKFFVTYLMLGVSVFSFGQDLTLQQAINTALSNNFDISISKLDIEAAKQLNNWAEAGRYPIVTLNFSQSNSLTERDNPTSFINGAITQSAFAGNLDVSWTLFNGFQVQLSKERLEQLEYVSANNTDLIIENTTQSVILAYHAALLQKELLSVQEKIIALSRSQYQYAKTKRELGQGNLNDYLQFEGAYFTDSVKYLEQRNTYATSLNQLKSLLAIEQSKEVTLTDSTVFSTTPISIDSLQTQVTKNNRQLRNMMLNQELIKNQVQSSKNLIFPRLSINTGSNYNSSSFDYENIGKGSGKSYDFYLNFSLTYTLFNAGNNKRRLNQAIIDQEQNLLEQEKIKLNLQLDLDNYIRNFTLQQELYNIQNQRVKTLLKQVELSKEQYNAGLINSIDVRNIQLNYLRASYDISALKYNFIDTQTNILRLTGNLLNTSK